MKLGIAVVYMVSERNERLLDLHLRQIEKNTTIPYTIYACVNHLLPRFLPKLEQNPRVTICPCEPYVARSGLLKHEQGPPAVTSDVKYEHSWYLEQLIRRAIDDGVTHVALFHVDSFPVRHGWDRELIARFSDSCVLAGAVRDIKGDYKPLTAAMLFPREFYLKHRPRLVLTQEDLDSPEYQRYLQAQPHYPDSGVGYGFRVFVEGLTWYPLVRSNLGGNHTLFGAVHGDMIFHLMATAVVDKLNVVGWTVRPTQRPGLVGLAARLAAVLVPGSLKNKLRMRASRHLKKRYQSNDRQDWERERTLLLEDPEAYLDYVRRGVKSRPLSDEASVDPKGTDAMGSGRAPAPPDMARRVCERRGRV
jgi:hypothetical protein